MIKIVAFPTTSLDILFLFYFYWPGVKPPAQIQNKFSGSYTTVLVKTSAMIDT